MDATRPASAPVTDEPWTTRRLLRWITERFETKGVDAPRVVAEMLLAHVLECDRMRLYMEVDRPATPDELAALRELVTRASDHEPVQYLVGHTTFYGRTFLVEPATIIPQPATEDLVSAVLAGVGADAPPLGTAADAEDEGDAPAPPPTGPPLRIADVGTGTGCIAITLARQLPSATLLATDVAAEALDLARRNAERHGVADRVELVEGDLLEPLLAAGDAFDVVCSNPPYIADDEWNDGRVDRAVREHVPERATRGGPDGLDFIRPLIAGAAATLRPGGLLAVEIGHAQRDAVLRLVAETPGLVEAEVTPDYEGFWRVLTARRAES
jgi:release factor glutamine methyltransferase